MTSLGSNWLQAQIIRQTRKKYCDITARKKTKMQLFPCVYLFYRDIWAQISEYFEYWLFERFFWRLLRYIAVEVTYGHLIHRDQCLLFHIFQSVSQLLSFSLFRSLLLPSVSHVDHWFRSNDISALACVINSENDGNREGEIWEVGSA